MDQLRKAWGWLQRQHFWVLTVIAVLVALFCWWSGANKLLAEYKTNRSKIDAEFSAAGTVRSKPFHPNTEVQTAQNEEIVNQQKGVFDLWQKLYGAQTAAVLKWPANLSEQFRTYIAKLKFGEEIPVDLRRHYNNYIRDHFPELPKIVGALEVPEGQAGGGGMGRGGGASFNIQSFLESRRGNAGGGREGGVEAAVEEPDFMVVWADQQLVRDELAPRSTPTSKRIWKTQEDLWVYEALLTIIANTNKAAGADRFSNAAVRVIETLEVGRTAAQASREKGRIDVVETAPAGGGGEGGFGGEGMGGEGMSREGPAGGGEMMMGEGGFGGEGMGRDGAGGMGAEGDAELFNNRYVDGTGTAIAATGAEGPEHYGKEFKRLPVQMRLWMDQRWLPQLITECANAPLQVEVQEVRINPSTTGMGGGGGRGGGYGDRGGMGGGYGGGAVEAMVPAAEPNMKTVVLQGTVYIFNPPSEAGAADESLATAGAE